MLDLVIPRKALVVPGIGEIALPEKGKPIPGIDVSFKGVREKFQLVMAGFANSYEVKVLEHVAGKTDTNVVTPIYLGLGEADPTETATGAAPGTESNYTGYTRASIAAAGWNSASAGAPSSITNASTITFPNCTAGSSVVTHWFLCTGGPARNAAGDVIMFGTVTSTTINTTQTPPTVAAAALSMTLD